MSEAFSPVSPHFFKIILEKTLREKKLLIPKKFVRLYGNSLSNWVCVKLPCGSEWKMEVLEYEGRVWLGKGWERFVEHYSIVRGHMICLKYEGNSRFEAVIFDTSTVEIDYPCKIRNCEEDPSEISDDFIAHPKSREKSQSPCSGDGKRKRTSLVEEPKGPRCNKVEQNSEKKGGYWSSDLEMKGKQDLPSTNTAECEKLAQRHNLSEDFRSLKYLDRYKNSAAFRKANCFTSDRPCFKVVMHPHCINNGAMNIPKTFAKYIVNKSEKVFLRVRTMKKKTWPVMQKWISNGRNRKKKPILSHGWKYFVEGNNLEIGDVCVFVSLKEQKNVSYEVVIFRVKENSEHPNSSAFCSGSTKVDHCEMPIKTEPGIDIENRTTEDKDGLRGKARLVSNNTVFRIIIQPSYTSVHSFIPIPWEIVQKYFKKEGNIILRVPNRGSWSMQFKVWHSIKTGHRTGKLTCGWNVFAKENDLKAGDVCIFQLIDGKILTSFEVSIIRFSKDSYYQQFKEENDSESDDTIKNETSTYCSGEKSPILVEEATMRKKALTSSEKTRFLERAYFKSKKPFFKVVVQPSYTSNGTHMPLPYDFARKYIKEEKVGFLRVQNSTRSWSVQFKFRRLKSNRLTAYISAGWREFAESNNLRVSDVCIFKLTNKIDITFNVSIVRAGIDDDLQRHSQEGDSSKCSDIIQRETKRVKMEVD